MKVKSVRRVKLDKPEAVYDITDVKFYSNFAIKTKSNTGVIVHNSGKSAFMLSECILSANKNYNILWVALGDLTKYDFLCRLSSNLTRVHYGEIAVNPDKYFDNNLRGLANKIHLVSVPANKLSAGEVLSLVENSQVYYDVVVIDYDSNLRANPNLNSYEAGGEIYNEVTSIARPDNGVLPRLVFIASQPKLFYWDHEILPLEAAGESARKQHTADMIITLGKVDCNASVHLAGYLNLPKVRRGTPNLRTPYTMDNTGTFHELSESELALIRRY